MHFNDTATDGQPHARAFAVSAMQPLEGFENGFRLFSGDTDTVVDHREQNGAALIW